jgi:hypothetical protein
MNVWLYILGLWLSGQLGKYITYALMRREQILREREEYVAAQQAHYRLTGRWYE